MPTRGGWSITLGDSAHETVVTNLNGAVLTNNNIVAQATAWAALEAAIVGVTNGTEQRTELENNTVPANPVWPANGAAFRSRKLAISYHDTSNGKRYTATVGTFDSSLVTFLAGTKDIDMTVGAAATLKTAFEAVVLSKDLNGVVIDRMREAGRNT